MKAATAVIAACSPAWPQTANLVSTTVYSGPMDKTFVHEQTLNEWLKIPLPAAIALGMPRSGFVRIFELRGTREDLLNLKERPISKENCVWYATEGRYAAHMDRNSLNVSVITGRDYLRELRDGSYAGKTFLVVMEGRNILPSMGGVWIQADSAEGYFSSGIAVRVAAPAARLVKYEPTSGWGISTGGGSLPPPGRPVSNFPRDCLTVEPRRPTRNATTALLMAKFNSCDAGPTTSGL